MYSTRSKRLHGFDKQTVWEEFTLLSNKYKAVNLGQGFPGWDAPDFAKKAIVDAVVLGQANQYCRSAGDIALTSALAEHYSDEFFGADLEQISQISRKLDPMTEITITVGASEALYAAMQAFVDAGDEVIIIEPCFDLYAPQVQMAGGKCVFVSLLPPERDSSVRSNGCINTPWRLDIAGLRAAVTPRTRAIILNTPHNPTGTVLSRDELLAVRQVVLDNPRLIVISDEVYEKLVFSTTDVPSEPGTPGISAGSTVVMKPVRFASLPGMWERTVTISSSGKTFSITGWKVGWCIGPTALVHAIVLTNQWVQFSVCTPAQRAVGRILSEAEGEYTTATSTYGSSSTSPSYFHYLQHKYNYKRMLVLSELTPLAPYIVPYFPQGTFFIVFNVAKYIGVCKPFQEYYLTHRKADVSGTGTGACSGIGGEVDVGCDWYFCRWMCQTVGVACIPLSAFYISDRMSSVDTTSAGTGTGADASVPASAPDPVVMQHRKDLHCIRLCYAKDDDTLRLGCQRLLTLLNVAGLATSSKS